MQMYSTVCKFVLSKCEMSMSRLVFLDVDQMDKRRKRAKVYLWCVFF